MKIIIALSVASCLLLITFFSLHDKDEEEALSLSADNLSHADESDTGLKPSSTARSHSTDAKTAKESTQPSRSTYKAFGKLIATATTNEEFTQALHDIENNADHSNVVPLLRELYEAWVEKDPLAALEYSQDIAERYNDTDFRTYALEKAAIVSIADAEIWLQKNNTGTEDEQDANTLAVYSGLAVNDPIEALQRIESLNKVYNKHLLELRALTEWAKLEPAQAIVWIENESSYTHAIGIEQAYLAVVSPLMDSAPRQAEAFILEMKPSAQKNKLISGYTQKLAQENGESAVTWARGMSEGTSYNTAMSAALEVMANSDGNQKKAIQYAKEEPDPRLRQKLVMQTIGYIAHNNPSVAATELSSLSYADQQTMAVTIAYSFSKHQKEDLQAWINALPSAELQQSVKEVFAN